MSGKLFRIYHTREKRTTNITKVRQDIYNPMTLLIDFEYTQPSNYYVREVDQIYGLYIDRIFIKEFMDKSVKVQFQSINATSIIEVFAHPHAGFQFIRSPKLVGNKIKLVFQQKDPNKTDIVKHSIYWDAGTGIMSTKKMGEIDAFTGAITGALLKTSVLQT